MTTAANERQCRVAGTFSCGIATYPPGATFGPRRLRDYEFVWLETGDAIYHCNGTEYSAPQGSLVLCRPGGSDGFTWDAMRQTRHAFIHFNVLESPDLWPMPKEWPLVRPALESEIFLPLFRYIIAWRHTPEEEGCNAALQLMLTAFVTGQSQLKEIAPHVLPDAVERALEFIRQSLENDMATPITLSEIAAAACVTPEHLCRIFKSATGRTPLETVRLARLDRAAGLLSRTNYSIGEIAALCGFASPFHFSRKFKEAYEKSPGELRSAVRKGGTPPLSRLHALLGP